MSQLTLKGDKLPLIVKDPNKELSPVEQKIYKFISKVGPRTEIEIRKHPAFQDILDVGRALRRMRQKGYVRSRPQRGNIPQLWEVVV